jgi:hypothetical protein
LPFLQEAIFLKFGNIIFFRPFAFLYLPPTLLSRLATDLHQIWHECVFLYRIETDEGEFEKFKNQVTTAKKHRKMTHFSYLPSRSGYFLNLLCDDI